MVLVTCSGKDTPGITSKLTGVLARHGLEILDIGQAVLHGWLSLSVLFQEKGGGTQKNQTPDPSPTEKAAIEDLKALAHTLQLKFEAQTLQDHAAASPPAYRYAVTLISSRVSAQALHAVTQVLAKHRVNINEIERLSESEFGCVELLLSSDAKLDRHALKTELLAAARAEGVDLALQAEGLYRRAKRLVAFDMDSTLIQSEIIDEFARKLGRYDEVAQITSEAMQGKIPFAQALSKRVACLQGLTQDQIDAVFNETELTPGAEDLIRVLKKLGYKIALISGGFSCIADRLKTRLGIDYAYANQLVLRDRKATGEVLPPIIDAQRKADLLEVIAQQEGIHLDQVIAVGDGANDLLMIEKAGLGIAFNAKPAVNARADLALNQRSLKSILYLLGISGRDVSEVLA
jgi:phosphoserine phosphatase